MTLTVDDLHRTLEDDRHLGWGYAEVAEYVHGRRREQLDRAIVAVANEQGLDYEILFHWSNSKHGRWLSDAVHGCNAPPTRATVRGLLNPSTIAASLDGVEILS